MKKLILSSLFLAFLLGEQIYAQNLTIGIKGGATISGILYSNSAPVPEHRKGILAGVSLLDSISEHIDFGTELIYEQKGYIDHFTYTDPLGKPIGTIKSTFMFDYLVLPCYFRFHTSKSIKLFIDLGLYPSYSISTKVASHTIDSNGNIGPKEKSKIDPEYLRHFDIGGIIGGGVEFKMNDNTTINLNLRYNNGAISVFEKQIFGQYMLINSLNFSLGLNYKIR